jgi:hypothetical protein
VLPSRPESSSQTHHVGLAYALPSGAHVTTMLDWISLGASLLLSMLAVLALLLTVLGVFVMGRGVL